MSNNASLMSGPPSAFDAPLFGDFELDQIFTGNKVIDNFQIAFGVEFLHRSLRIQLERLQCIADGALLAVEQVQDVRLDLLEKGPEVSTGAVLLDLFVGLLLDSSVAGSLMKKFGEIAVKRMVRRQGLFAGEANKAYSLVQNLRGLGSQGFKYELAGKGTAILAAELKAAEYLKAADRWRRVAEFASNSDRIKDATAGAKGLAKGLQKNWGTKPLEIDGDTPGVALLGSVQEFLATNHFVVIFQYERMETLIRVGSMSGDDARKLLQFAEMEAIDSPLKPIRDRCKLLFEAIIWAGMFKFDQSSNRTRPATFTRRDYLTGIDDRILDYWLRRFGPEIQRWTNEMGNQSRFNLGRKNIDDWATTYRIVQVGSLEAYFKTVLSELPGELADSKALTSNYILSP